MRPGPVVPTYTMRRPSGEIARALPGLPNRKMGIVGGSVTDNRAGGPAASGLLEPDTASAITATASSAATLHGSHARPRHPTRATACGPEIAVPDRFSSANAASLAL